VLIIRDMGVHCYGSCSGEIGYTEGCTRAGVGGDLESCSERWPIIMSHGDDGLPLARHSHSHVQR